MEYDIETLIIGGGQAGLCTSYYLREVNHPHMVLEKGDIPAPVWRDDRWDSFTLVTPNSEFRLPGYKDKNIDPIGFMKKNEIVRIFSEYVSQYKLPIKYGITVLEISKRKNGFIVKTSQGNLTSKNVVMATGLFQFPRKHTMSERLKSSIVQIHSGSYRNSESLIPGGVLIVGSSQSGCQIAAELNKAGRQVWLCVGKSRRVPRSYRNKDIFEWLELSGMMQQKTDQLSSPLEKLIHNPILSGKKDDGSLNLHKLARDGVHLLGSLKNIEGTYLTFNPDLHINLKSADDSEIEILNKFEDIIRERKLNLPIDNLPQYYDGFSTLFKEHVDINDLGVTTIIWATGYQFNFDIVHFPVFDNDGYPIQKRGVTIHPGLYFIGLPWLYSRRSGLLSGVAEDAEYVANYIIRRGG